MKFVCPPMKRKNQVRIIQDPESKRCSRGCCDDGSTAPKVSKCSKASESDSTTGIETDGYPVSLSTVRAREVYESCLDKRVNFYPPSPRPLDHGQVLVNIFGDINGQPPFKIYGPEDSGKVERAFRSVIVKGWEPSGRLRLWSNKVVTDDPPFCVEMCNCMDCIYYF